VNSFPLSYHESFSGTIPPPEVIPIGGAIGDTFFYLGTLWRLENDYTWQPAGHVNTNNTLLVSLPPMALAIVVLILIFWTSKRLKKWLR
jgi:hypothetical protein